VAVSGTHAYVTGGCCGLHVIDIANAISPRLVGGGPTPESASQDVVVSGTHAFIADGSAGLVIVHAQCQSPVSVSDSGHSPLPAPLSVVPNPTLRHAVIGFGTSGNGPVLIGVYDPAGRSVRRLYAGGLPAGDHRISWDGREGSGRVVPAGIYFVRVLTPKTSAVARLVVVR
jgi:hypothetical protein